MKLWLRIVDKDDELIFAPVKPTLFKSDWKTRGGTFFRYKSVSARALRDAVVHRLMFVGIDGVPLAEDRQPVQVLFDQPVEKGVMYRIPSAALVTLNDTPATATTADLVMDGLEDHIGLELLEETVNRLRTFTPSPTITFDPTAEVPIPAPPEYGD